MPITAGPPVVPVPSNGMKKSSLLFLYMWTVVTRVGGGGGDLRTQCFSFQVNVERSEAQTRPAIVLDHVTARSTPVVTPGLGTEGEILSGWGFLFQE